LEIDGALANLDEWFDSPLSVIAEKIAVLGSTFKIFFAVFWAGLSALEGTKYEFIVFKCQMGNDLLTDIKSDEDGPAMRASIEVFLNKYRRNTFVAPPTLKPIDKLKEIGSVTGYFIKANEDSIRMKTVIVKTYRYMIGQGFVLPALDDFFENISQIRVLAAFWADDDSSAYDMYYRRLERRISAPIEPAEMLLVRRVVRTPYLLSMPDSDRVSAECLVMRFLEWLPTHI